MTSQTNLEELRTIMLDLFPDSEIPENILELKINDLPDWDSVGNFNLLLEVEERFGTRFPLDQFANINSVKSILEHLE